MKTFIITSTINIEAINWEDACRKLQQKVYNKGQLSEIGFDLLRNAEIEKIAE